MSAASTQSPQLSRTRRMIGGGLVILGVILVSGSSSSHARGAVTAAVDNPPLPGGAAQSLQTYLKSALMLRDIHSLKLTRSRRWADGLRFGLIALTTIATCLGFIGVADMASDLGVDPGLVNFTVNVVLLLLLLVVIGELAWRQGDRANEHQRAIVVLTSFVRDLENRLRQAVDPKDIELVERFGARHELLIEILPPHTDRDYLAAKRAAAKKIVKKAEIKLGADRRAAIAEKKRA